MASPAKQNNGKRNSNEVDKLMAQVERLVKGGMSVNKACAQVGLQNTVYYFRKRKEVAIEALNSTGTSTVTSHRAVDASQYSNKDMAELEREYRELESKLQTVKLKIAEKVMASR